MKDEYPSGKADLMTAFMLKSQALTKLNGSWGMINLPSWMSLKSFERLRQDLLRDQRLVSMVHLGRGVFGSDFGSVAFVVTNARSSGGRAIYRRLFDQHVDVRSVAAIEALFHDRDYNCFEVAQSDFAAIPGSPIVYWLSEKVRAAFRNGRPLAAVAEPRQGMATADNGRYVRQWWEVSKTRTAFDCPTNEAALESGARWFPYTDGGEFRRWYGNRHVVVNWENDGQDLRAFERSVVRNPSFYFRESVTWSAVGSGVPAFRAVPAGSLFSNAGMSVFATPEQLIKLVALCNSTTAELLFGAIAPTLNLGVGEIGKLPVTTGAQDSVQTIPKLVAGSKEDWDNSETSWDFSASPLVAVARGEVR